jgi:glutamate synthase domain-containing protein 3
MWDFNERCKYCCWRQYWPHECIYGTIGSLVVCGDAGDALGDSIYEAKIYVRGKVKSLGTDCVEKEMRDEHKKELEELLSQSKMSFNVEDFRRYGSARKLYNFDIDQVDEY